MAPFRIGHWSDNAARTGCTVVLFDLLVPAIVDVRGGAPATRETDLLSADRSVGSVDAILLTGGSAFGLSAADGVMRYLREAGRGWPTAVMPIPIVPAAALFDLGVGSPVWPGPDAGLAACQNAADPAGIETGAVGAGTGATIRKLWPDAPPLPGGFGYAVETVGGDVSVHALVAVNAVGEVVQDTADAAERRRSLLVSAGSALSEREATTLGVVIVEGAASERALRRAAVAAHDGYARAIVPAHTAFDGDLVFACATGGLTEDDHVRDVRVAIAAELAIEGAIRNAVAS